MSIDRRQFLLSAAALAASARPAFPHETVADGSIFPPSVRADFPIASAQTYLNSASIHPMSMPCSQALTQHIAFRLKGGGEGRADFGEDQQKDLKRRFAQLIGAKPNENPLFPNTPAAGDHVVLGMGPPLRRGKPA